MTRDLRDGIALDYASWQRLGPIVLRYGRCGGKLWWDLHLGRLLVVRW